MRDRHRRRRRLDRTVRLHCAHAAHLSTAHFVDSEMHKPCLVSRSAPSAAHVSREVSRSYALGTPCSSSYLKYSSVAPRGLRHSFQHPFAEIRIDRIAVGSQPCFCSTPGMWRRIPIVSITEPARIAAEKAHRSWRGDAAHYIDRIFSRTSNVQQQEAAHDAEIFVKAIHTVDSFCAWH